MQTRISVGELMRCGEAALQTGPFGTQLKAEEYVHEGVPVINVRNVGFGDVRDDDLEFVTEAKAEQLHHHRLLRDDIVFGRKGAVERHGLITDAQEGWVQGSDCLRLRLRSARVDIRYLSYYLRTKAHGDWMHALCSFGATMASLNQDIVSRITFPAPPIEVQRKIAAILSAYDDLIANNQRRIALLEGMAEEIYREWFVRMRFPGADATTAADAIPAGWTLESLEDLGTFLNGYAFDPSEWFDFGLPIIKIKELNSGVSADTPRNPGERLQERYRFSDGDVIFSWSGSLVVKIWDQGDGWLNQHLFKVTPKESVSRLFLYLSIKFSIPIFESLTTGATMQHIKRKELRFVKVRVPGSELMQLFDQQVAPMLNAALTLKQTNRRLSETRDALLPRLISGKLKVDYLDIRLPPSMRADAEAVA